MKKTLFATLLSLVAAGGLLAQGSPPMLTDDTAPPDVGKWEVSVGCVTEHTPGATAFEAPTVDIAYGLVKNLELGYSISNQGEHESGEGTRWGLGRSEVDIKWRFFGDGEHGLQMAVTPTLSFPTPGTHSVDRGLVEDHAFLRLPFEFERSVGEFNLVLEVGPTLATNHADQNSWEGGFNVGREITKGWTLGAEVYVKTDKSMRQSEWIFNVGTAIDLSEHFSLLAAVGRDLRNTLGDKVSFLSYTGVQFRF